MRKTKKLFQFIFTVLSVLSIIAGMTLIGISLSRGPGMGVDTCGIVGFVLVLWPLVSIFIIASYNLVFDSFRSLNDL